jgi:hypothetical protein
MVSQNYKKQKKYFYSGSYIRDIEFWKKRDIDTSIAFCISVIFLIISYFFGSNKDMGVSSFFCAVSAGVLLLIKVKIDMLTEDLNHVLNKKGVEPW